MGKAFIEGWRRVLHAPAVTAGLLVGHMLVNLPMTMAIRGLSGESTVVAYSRLFAFAFPDWEGRWVREIAGQIRSLEWIFAHEIFGFGGASNLAAQFFDSSAFPSVSWLITINVVFWMFISGGVLDRYARGRPTRSAGFFAACGVHFFRFFRLGILMGAIYWMLFAGVLPAMLPGRSAPVISYLAVLIVVIVSLIGDYAKVRIVVEDRRSAFGAIAAGWRFVWRRPFQTFGLYLLNAVVMLLVLAAWRRVRVSSTSEWTVVLVGTIALLLQIVTRLGFMAAAVVFFQNQLAHAEYTAAPVPTWPESPSAEAIENLTRRL